MHPAAQIEQAKYDLDTLPRRQSMLRHMLKEPWQSVDAIRILGAEHAANARRIEAAKVLLSMPCLA